MKGNDMYIDKLWGECFGDTEDSFVLMDYFNEDDKTEYSIKKIFNDFNIYNEYSQIKSDSFRSTKDIKYISNNNEHDIDIVIDLILDLSVLVLECLNSKQIKLKDLDNNSKDKYISINADKEDIEMFINVLEDFSNNSLEYDLADICDDETCLFIADKTKYIAKEMSQFLN
ncbi:imm68 putative immunity domain-containing protein [uncultured Brachyspira sp.]|uniref:imm68 putative immunity domain-containing protein n=1 Tax=uncultured Brachyspira sp. TaxID=221953 RepID=UPI00261F0995|nr:imm68 putative immunity domain-containing protein [uncultured Brachyspira sp.]